MSEQITEQVTDSQQKLSFQMLFDNAWQHFIVKKNKPAIRGDECAYRDADGNACAIGVSLPDSSPAVHCREMFSDLVSYYPELWAKDVLQSESQDLDEFQQCLHDFHVDMPTKKWKKDVDLRAEYLEVARIFKLRVPNEEKSGGV